MQRLEELIPIEPEMMEKLINAPFSCVSFPLIPRCMRPRLPSLASLQSVQVPLPQNLPRICAPPFSNSSYLVELVCQSVSEEFRKEEHREWRQRFHEAVSGMVFALLLHTV